MNRFRLSPTLLLIAAVLTLGACASTERVSRTGALEAKLPEVPRVRDPLDVQLTYPKPGAVKPDFDSTFVFGTTRNGGARLTINGLPTEVAPNGAFLAYVPAPDDGTYRLTARRRGRTDTEVYTYAQPQTTLDTSSIVDPATSPTFVPFPEPRLTRVVSGKDTLATGSEIANAAPTPTGDRRWFFPIGAKVIVTGQLGSQYQIKLTDETGGWIDSSVVDIERTSGYEIAPIGSVQILPQAGYTDVVLPVDFAPFQIDPLTEELGVTIYGRTASVGNITPGGVIEQASWASSSADSVRLILMLHQGLWGFKAFYELDGDLVVRVRQPPAIDLSQPFRGLHILIDPGHPPGGAIGPTGYTEPDANLDISLRLAEMLRDRGATVLMTRTTPEPLVSETNAAQELWARVDTAVALNADLLVSVHNNAFPDGVNPFENFGTETYYYHEFSAPLAQELLKEIHSVTGIPNLGAKQRSLALVRPTWFPSTLTESLFMMFPRQEAALRHAEFLDDLAAAHVRGIENFLLRYVEISNE